MLPWPPVSSIMGNILCRLSNNILPSAESWSVYELSVLLKDDVMSHFMGAVYCMLALMISPGDWPQILGPNRDGVAVNEKTLLPWPVSGPKKLWEREAGSGFAGPVVAKR